MVVISCQSVFLNISREIVECSLRGFSLRALSIYVLFTISYSGLFGSRLGVALEAVILIRKSKLLENQCTGPEPKKTNPGPNLLEYSIA